MEAIQRSQLNFGEIRSPAAIFRHQRQRKEFIFTTLTSCESLPVKRYCKGKVDSQVPRSLQLYSNPLEGRHLNPAKIFSSTSSGRWRSRAKTLSYGRGLQIPSILGFRSGGSWLSRPAMSSPRLSNVLRRSMEQSAMEYLHLDTKESPSFPAISLPEGVDLDLRHYLPDGINLDVFHFVTDILNNASPVEILSISFVSVVLGIMAAAIFSELKNFGEGDTPLSNLAQYLPQDNSGGGEPSLMRLGESGKTDAADNWLNLSLPSPFYQSIAAKCPSLSSTSVDNFARTKRRRRELRSLIPEFQRTYLQGQDGGAVALDWPSELDLKGNKEMENVLLLVCGTTQGSNELGIGLFTRLAAQHGYFPVILNPRGCGGTILTTPRVFSAADSDDVDLAALFLAKSRPWATMFAVGWGYGANMLAKYLGEQASATPVTAAVCIDNPFDLSETTHTMSGSRWLAHDRAMVQGLVQILETNKMVFQGQRKGFDVNGALEATSLHDFDKAISCVAHGYESVEEFYKNNSSSRNLTRVQIPLLCIQHREDYEETREVSVPQQAFERNAFTMLLVSKAMGSGVCHPGAASEWTHDITLEWLSAVEISLLKGRHPLLGDFNSSIKLPKEWSRGSLPAKDPEPNALPASAPRTSLPLDVEPSSTAEEAYIVPDPSTPHVAAIEDESSGGRELVADIPSEVINEPSVSHTEASKQDSSGEHAVVAPDRESKHISDGEKGVYDGESKHDAKTPAASEDRQESQLLDAERGVHDGQSKHNAKTTAAIDDGQESHLHDGERGVRGGEIGHNAKTPAASEYRHESQLHDAERGVHDGENKHNEKTPATNEDRHETQPHDGERGAHGGESKHDAKPPAVIEDGQEAKPQLAAEEPQPAEPEEAGRIQMAAVAESVMNVLDVTMPGVLPDHKKQEVLKAIGRGETLVTALEGAVPEDVRDKMSGAVSEVLNNQNLGQKGLDLANQAEGLRLPEVSGELQEKLSEMTGKKGLGSGLMKPEVPEIGGTGSPKIAQPVVKESASGGSKPVDEKVADTVKVKDQPQTPQSDNHGADADTSSSPPPSPPPTQSDPPSTEAAATDSSPAPAVSDPTAPKSDPIMPDTSQGDPSSPPPPTPKAPQSSAPPPASGPPPPASPPPSTSATPPAAASPPPPTSAPPSPGVESPPPPNSAPPSPAAASPPPPTSAPPSPGVASPPPPNSAPPSPAAASPPPPTSAPPSPPAASPPPPTSAPPSPPAAAPPPPTNAAPPPASPAPPPPAAGAPPPASPAPPPPAAGAPPPASPAPPPPAAGAPPPASPAPPPAAGAPPPPPSPGAQLPSMGAAVQALTGFDDSTQMAVTNVFGVVENLLDQFEKDHPPADTPASDTTVAQKSDGQEGSSHKGDQATTEITGKTEQQPKKSSKKAEDEVEQKSQRSEGPSHKGEKAKPETIGKTEELNPDPKKSSKADDETGGGPSKDEPTPFSGQTGNVQQNSKKEHQAHAVHGKRADGTRLKPIHRPAKLEEVTDGNSGKNVILNQTEQGYIKVDSDQKMHTSVEKEDEDDSQALQPSSTPYVNGATSKRVDPESDTEGGASERKLKEMAAKMDVENEGKAESLAADQVPAEDEDENDGPTEVKDLVVNALKLEVVRRLGGAGLSAIGVDLELELAKVGEAVSGAVGSSKDSLLEAATQSADSDTGGGLQILNGSTVTTAVGSVLGPDSPLGRLLPFGVLVGAVMASLGALHLIVSDDEEEESAQARQSIAEDDEASDEESDEESDNDSAHPKTVAAKVEHLTNRTAPAVSVKSDEVSEEQNSNGYSSTQIGTQAHHAEGEVAHETENSEESEESESPHQGKMMGALAAAMGATAAVASQSKASTAVNVAGSEAAGGQNAPGMVPGIAEKALSMVAPVVPKNEEGEVDQERLVAMLTEVGQKGGLLTLVGKVALLWGGLRGAMSLADRLIAFFHLGERPLPQRLLGFGGMAILLWTPVLVPLLPTLLQQWATNSPGGVADAAAGVGLYGALFILVTIWGRRVRGYERPLVSYGLKITSRPKLQLFAGGLGVGLVLVTSYYGINWALGYAQLTWNAVVVTSPVFPGPLASTVLTSWKMLGLVGQSLTTAMAISLVEEVLFRAWLQEEVAADLGIDWAVILTGVAFSLVHWSPQAFVGYWFLSVALSGARAKNDGDLSLPIGIHAGMVFAYSVINQGALFQYLPDSPIWLTGAYAGNPLAGALGTGMVAALAVVLYPREKKALPVPDPDDEEDDEAY